MAEHSLSRIFKTADRPASIIWTAVLVILAVTFIGSGVFTGKLGLVICGIGWVIFFIAPLFFKGSGSNRLALWLKLVGALIFLLGLAVHSGAL